MAKLEGPVILTLNECEVLLMMLRHQSAFSYGPNLETARKKIAKTRNELIKQNEPKTENSSEPAMLPLDFG